MFEKGEVVDKRFRIDSKLGEGGMGVTYLCEEIGGEKKVVLKALRMDRLSDWKSMDLFKREASVLKAIDHPFIPSYIDFFEYGKDKDLSFVLIQEYIPGTNLQKKADEGFHASEDEVSEIGVKLLSIVSYIHGLRPPVIHRDINPKNIIMTKNGDIYLVDFGSVQDMVRSELEHGSTFVGTPGYTPIEQFQGQATPRSDLYAIAATMVFLLTHREVTDFTSDGLVIDVTQFAQSKGLRAVLANYLDPDAKKRTLSPENAILILQGKKEPVREEKHGAISEAFMSMLEEVKRASSKSDMSVDRDIRKDPGLPPPGSMVKYSGDKNYLDITIPAGPGGSGGMGAFALIWNAFIFFFSAIMISSGFITESLAPFLPLFMFLIPFWAIGIGFGYAALFNRFGKTTIHLERDSAGTVAKEFIIKRSKVFETEHVSECQISVAYTSNNSPVYQCKLVTPRKGFSFGQKLSNAEKKWICNTVNYWINQRRD